MSTVIKIENVSKRFAISASQFNNYNFREYIMYILNAPFRRFRPALSKGLNAKEFWALKNVTLEIKQGEVIGIIGSNGSGKSTLLKILSRITEPTEGCVKIKGRIASLLEVGTGFHPELTGRENIYLNGAILGMGRKEINKKFDEIVEFAEINEFLDTPVKRYSSGMYVRLAFAVAAHLEPEILIIDEVLAVGDSKFQSKSMGKMQDIAGNGRTVFMVSHNMEAISKLCTKAVLLRNGQITAIGKPYEVISSYRFNEYPAFQSLINHPNRDDGFTPRLMSVDVYSCDGELKGVIPSGSPCEVVLKLTEPPPASAKFSIGISDSSGAPVSHLSLDLEDIFDESELLSNEVRCRIKNLPLAAGRYSLSIGYRSGEKFLGQATSCATFDVVELSSCKPPRRSYRSAVLRHSWTERSIQ
jgi:lipopolysaccharide transport system ATP-binding protein